MVLMVQTWLPLPSFRESLRCLSDAHLHQQRFHVLEIMESMHCIKVEDSQLPEDYRNALRSLSELENLERCERMWTGYDLQLCEYGLEACEEFSRRFPVANDSLYTAISRHMDWAEGEEAEFGKPDWFGDVDFHLSHQAALLRLSPTHYTFKVDTSRELVWPVSKYAKE